MLLLYVLAWDTCRHPDQVTTSNGKAAECPFAVHAIYSQTSCVYMLPTRLTRLFDVYSALVITNIPIIIIIVVIIM